MDIRQLHYFLVLCEEMNYTRASQRLFLSRQALRQSSSVPVRNMTSLPCIRLKRASASQATVV